MSLSAHEQETLHTIEEQLAGSDPKLASLLAMFTRLTLAEEMPVREKLRAGCRRATRRQPVHRRHPLDRARWRTRRVYRRMGRQRAMLLLVLLTAIVLTATALALSRSGGTWACIQPWTVSCAGEAPTHRWQPAAQNKALGQPRSWAGFQRQQQAGSAAGGQVRDGQSQGSGPRRRRSPGYRQDRS